MPAEIPEIHFADALAVAGAAPDEPDLAPADERALSEWALRTYGSEFLFVTGYPMRKRPFYTHPDPARPAYSTSFDLLFRGVELVTGGQRPHRYADYLAVLPDPEPYEGLPRRLPARHAAARRVRARPGALDRQVGGRAEHPADHLVPEGSAQAQTLTCTTVRS